MKAIASLFSRFVFIAVVCLSSASNAWSTTISYEANPSGMIPLFDPGLGSLTSVLVSVDLSARVSMQVFNSGTETQNFTVSKGASVYISGAVPVSFVGGYFIDFEADPGVTRSSGVATIIDSFLLEGSTISNFIGVGELLSGVGSGFGYFGSFAYGEVPNITPQTGVQHYDSTLGSATYSYNYTPTVVSAPGTIWLFGPMLILFACMRCDVARSVQ